MIFVACLHCLSVYAEETRAQTRLWSSFYWRAPIKESHQWFYSLESTIRFVDEREKFDYASLDPGVGKEIFSGLSLWCGVEIQQENNGKNLLQTLIIPWEAIIWNMYSSPLINVKNRLRVEERKKFSHSNLAVRVRERIKFEIPIMGSEHYYCDLYNEIIFNAVSTGWDGDKLVNQNRASVSLRYQYHENTALSLGYLFSYKFRDTNEASNVIVLRFEYNN